MFDGMYEFCQLSAGGSIGMSKFTGHQAISCPLCLLFPKSSQSPWPWQCILHVLEDVEIMCDTYFCSWSGQAE